VDKAQEYKQRLGTRARDIIAFGMGLSKYSPNKNQACCPFHNDRKPSFKWYDKGLTWKCFGCGETMDIYRYLQEFKHMTFREAVEEVGRMVGEDIKTPVYRPVTVTYRKPDIQVKELSQAAIDYFANRGISLQTLNDWRVKQRTWHGKEVFVFQYFDDKDELQYVSYREIKKDGFKGGCEPNTKPILWGVWHIDVTKPVVITEGQPDALAIWEAGYRNVVSVPSGCNSFTWIDNCWEWLQKVQEFIIFGDNDAPGLKFIDELCIRLGKHRTKVIEHQYKDANEVLLYQGKDEIMRLINEAIERTPTGIIDMSKVQYEGVKDEDGIPTGFYGLDSVIEDLKPGQLSILVGRNSEGKSTAVSQMICNAIDNDIPVFLYSGEMGTQRILNWLFRQAIGDEQEYLKFVQTKYRLKTEVKPEAVQALMKWMSGKFYTFDKSVINVRKDTGALFEVMEIAVKRYGCKLIIIDNLMSALEDSADAQNANQSNFTQQCKDFAEAYKVHVMLVCHPNKLKRQGEKLEKEDISGSANISNKADIIVSIERQFREDRNCDALLRLLKDRENGKYAEVKLIFQESTKRLLEVENGTVRPIQYDWKRYLPEYEHGDAWEPPDTDAILYGDDESVPF